MINKTVKKEMIDQELTITKLSHITGYTRCHLCNVINGNVDSVKAKKNIALRLNRDFKELWGDKAIS